MAFSQDFSSAKMLNFHALYKNLTFFKVRKDYLFVIMLQIFFKGRLYER
ncbi:hypothetical protein HMPREF9444_00209 [Succinatimonas hippei YIT 12066]|uniref:Uncharacterized protein n=1 Tax=Succinatimonas hippei (strain DSM 22608 / JCM 16073 / KCTC 15190 / YIT 12066) TaxID=762983 RepID=E8LHN0_SUCHY|nr:hypothetical protein HMPREF9444_00209 [Succinatimonas hippei YIT 12066]